MTFPVVVYEGLKSPLCRGASRSEEHTSELQSRLHLVCRPLLEKKKPTSIDILGLQAVYAKLRTYQYRDYSLPRYPHVRASFGGRTSHDAYSRPFLDMLSNV